MREKSATFCTKCGLMSDTPDRCTNCGAPITARESARDTVATAEWGRAHDVFRLAYRLIFLRAFQEASDPQEIIATLARYPQELSAELKAFREVVKKIAAVSEETMDRLSSEAVWNNPLSMGDFEDSEDVDSQRRRYKRYLRKSLGIVGLESASDHGLMLGTVIELVDAALKVAPELEREELRSLVSSALRLAGLKRSAQS